MRTKKPRAEKTIHLPVRYDERVRLRFAIEHAISSPSEAHPKDLAELNALIARLNAAEARA